MAEFIYVGQYYHKHGKDLGITEKKIGFTKNLDDRERALNSTKMTIGYAIVAAWSVENMRLVEGVLHNILDPLRLDGEWFEDPNEDLASRVNYLITSLGLGERVDIEDDEAEEVKEIRKKVNVTVDEVLTNLNPSYDKIFLRILSHCASLDANAPIGVSARYLSFKPNWSSRIIAYLNYCLKKEMVIDVGPYKDDVSERFPGFYKWGKNRDGEFKHYYFGIRLTNDSSEEEIQQAIDGITTHFNDRKGI